MCLTPTTKGTEDIIYCWHGFSFVIWAATLFRKNEIRFTGGIQLLLSLLAWLYFTVYDYGLRARPFIFVCTKNLLQALIDSEALPNAS